MREIGIKNVRGILNRYSRSLTRVYNSKSDKSLLNYCHALQFESAMRHLCYKKAPGIRSVLFAIQGYLHSQANLVAIQRELPM